MFFVPVLAYFMAAGVPAQDADRKPAYARLRRNAGCRRWRSARQADGSSRGRIAWFKTRTSRRDAREGWEEPCPPPLRRCPGRPAGSRRWRAKSDAGKTAWRADGCAASPGRQGCGAEEPFTEVGTLRATGSLPEFARPVCRMKIE